MIAVILAGGYGTRISEESAIKPKPMIEIGTRPIIWHLMKSLSEQGISDFVICLGYKGYLIKEFFANYSIHTADLTVDLSSGKQTTLKSWTEDWRVTLIDSGEDALTAERLKRVREYVGESPFLFTYGDGLSDVAIGDLVNHHKVNNNLVTVTAVQPQGRYGTLQINDENVTMFSEKTDSEQVWVNGGFFIVDPQVLELIPATNVSWEQVVLPKLAADGNLGAFKHSGFWFAMDTLRDKNHLENLWNSGRAPWKNWL
jgi:glucose-1-phosphate cytidylyltransferase